MLGQDEAKKFETRGAPVGTYRSLKLPIKNRGSEKSPAQLVPALATGLFFKRPLEFKKTSTTT